MNNVKRKPTTTTHTGVYKAESIKDVAESLGIGISDPVATALASDVEYRIHQVVEEAAKFMRHGRRTTMTTADIDHALRVLNIEPLYGHTPHNPPSFRRAPPFMTHPSSMNPANQNSASSTVYFVEDEELDFDRVLREEKIALPKGVSWTAHWLAVEGVQPLIPENPPAIPRDTGEAHLEAPSMNGTTAIPMTTVHGSGLFAQPSGGLVSTITSASTVGAAGTANAMVKKSTPTSAPPQSQNLVKQVLSRELQLYYSRLTGSLLPPSTSDWTKRSAALASLRNDAGLQALLPYLIRWVGEGVVGALKEGAQSENDGKILEVLMDVISAILENQTLFVEPYLHQLLPPLLSTLLHSSLPPTHSTQLRISASQTLSRLLTTHSTTYPSLSPRIMKTLLLALISPSKSKGSREGAVWGLVGVGKEAVRKGVVEGGGARVLGDEYAPKEGEQEDGLVKAVVSALRVLHPRSETDMNDGLDPDIPSDKQVIEQLEEVLGEYFASKVLGEGDAAWARAILGKEEDV
ncbi:TAF-domain-containing protein [Dendrothele bispora CBS 962.96]|uniref:TBP-associated factor 6 n=1 Tax=Dendrothele bispora (strain CBS 962.96) TaxID=1314807 RepID=A0A4S8MGB0_DENBC|nr:TAF-domain-containing protein [Dendrothele bispora CBS 962.96]